MMAHISMTRFQKLVSTEWYSHFVLVRAGTGTQTIAEPSEKEGVYQSAASFHEAAEVEEEATAVACYELPWSGGICKGATRIAGVAGEVYDEGERPPSSTFPLLLLPQVSSPLLPQFRLVWTGIGSRTNFFNLDLWR